LKIVRESIYEKFSDETDPVKDMGISGIERLKEILYSIPPGTCTDLYNFWFRKYCSNDYVDYSVALVRIMYHTVKTIIENPELTPQQSFEKTTAKEIKKKDKLKDPKIRLKILKKVAEMLEIKFDLDVDPYFETKKVNEKFTDYSDPIVDMGIGVLSSLKPGSILQCIKPISPRVNHNKFTIEKGWYSVIKKIEIKKSSIKKTKIELEISTYDKFPKTFKVADLQFSGGEYLTLLPDDFFEHFEILPYEVNEKFTEESDAITDMNIGQNHFKEEIMKMVPAKYQHMGIDYIEFIRYVLFSDETTVEKDNDFMKGNTIYTIICHEYSKNKFFEELLHMIEVKGFVNDKGVAIDQTKQKGNRLTIVMSDGEKIDE
jgi:hypothetical protein